MKKMLALLIAGTAITAVSYAQTTVSSANVVGYNQITIPSNQFVLVALDFETADNSISNVFNTLPVSSRIYLWDTGNQKYKLITRNAENRGGWGTNGATKITKGVGAFVALPANVQTNIFFSGDVPTVATSSIYQVNGFALIAYPYPADVAFTNTALAKNAVTGDRISVWNNGWSSYTKNAENRGGWNTASNVIIKVGQAFFYQSTTNSTVNELKPYTLD
jgi:hypothetical protein